MQKLYLVGLMLFTLVINSYVADNTAFGDTGDGIPKMAHFYPNPATSYINFTFEKTIDKTYSLQVYNFIGRKMNDIRINDAKITINLDDNYFRGLYVYQLRDQSGRIVESGKFQVNK
ncbi:MAG: T9SS type A sorting domain-containing protein [Bacteroidota bacterium]